MTEFKHTKAYYGWFYLGLLRKMMRDDGAVLLPSYREIEEPSMLYNSQVTVHKNKPSINDII